MAEETGKAAPGLVAQGVLDNRTGGIPGDLEADPWQDTLIPGSPYYSGRVVRERMTRLLTEKARREEEEMAEEGRSPIILPTDLIEEHQQATEPEMDVEVPSGGILLPSRPEPGRDQKPPSILVPGRDT